MAGSALLVQWLANCARSYVFSTAPAGPLAAAALCSLRWIDEYPERRQQVLASARQLREELASQGWMVSGQKAQIIALPVGDPGLAVQLSADLREQGMLLPAIRPPTVPGGESMLRISVGYRHRPADLEQLASALDKCRGLLV